MITLYDFGNSVACQKVRIALCEKGLDWKTIKIDLFRSEQYDPEYLKFNPDADHRYCKSAIPAIRQACSSSAHGTPLKS